ncbi:hypothetical protein AMTR_s00077p00143080 [Amborella trichopoda]|uniref:Late embryogenesis abundant protein LEA-2 subgroup domain-containing protein n=1 Tax=Amborella trichopoda TaxID=13333 RepID=W1P991_AMBTC|nr:hypothetical protein AMTR_s00077p00143080 [Amborella trichopoda]
MADPKSHGSVMPLPKPPGHDARSPTAPQRPMQVSFPTHSPNKPRKKKPRRCCCSCCLWICVLLLVLILFLCLVGFAVFVYFRPTPPKFKVETLKFKQFSVESRSQQLYLTSNVQLFVEALNKNDRFGFSYDHLSALVFANDVSLGGASFPRFLQPRKNTTVMNFPASVMGSLVDNAEGKEMESKYKAKQLDLNVELRGNLRIIFRRWSSGKLEFQLWCEGVNQHKISMGMEPQCKVKLFGW